MVPILLVKSFTSKGLDNGMDPGCHSISAAALGENNAAHEIKVDRDLR
jgi:hypothetical protein